MPSIPHGFSNGDLQGFYRLAPGDTAGAQSTPSSVDRAALAVALERYHRDLGTLDERQGRHPHPRSVTLRAQLERLAHPQARTVVAGQQAGLLGGPAFAVHKAADAILLAHSLHREDAPVLPIFWVASQDHDAAEVASSTLLDLDERLYPLSLPLPAGRPVADIALEPQWVEDVLEALADFAAPEEHRQRVFGLLREAAAGATSYADWFSRLMHLLLAEHGLIVLDPAHPALAALFAPAIRRELHSPLEGPRRIEAAAQRLLERGYTPQLRRPEGASNLFLTGGDGQRRLLRLEGGRFFADRAYPLSELEAILEADPRRITPAAGLRPIVQDSALPSVALILGPGELAYATQLRELYPLHDLEQPLLWPRLKVTWLEPPVARILGKYGLSAAQFQADPKGSLERVLLERSGVREQSAARLERIGQELQQILESVRSLDPTLLRPLEKAQWHAGETVRKLEMRLGQNLRIQENHAERQFDRLERHLLPYGVPQERQISFLSFLLKHGWVPLERLLAQQAGANVELELS